MIPLRFDGRVALITGAGRGMGRAHAMLLAERGAKLIVNDLGVAMGGENESGAPAEDVASEIRKAGGDAVANMNDVSAEAGASAMVQAAIDHFGRLDIVVHNAGVVTFIPFAEMSYAQYRKLVAVHQDGGFLLAKAAWPHMVEQAYGRFIFITSNAAMGSLAHYASAKMALTGFVRSLGAEGAPNNIRANALSVFAYTRMMSGYFHADSGHADVGLFGQTALENRWRDNLRPEQVSPAVGWLAHEGCTVTGETFMSGGGQIARQYITATEGFAHVDLTPEMIEAQRARVVGIDKAADMSGEAGLGVWMQKIVNGGAPVLPSLQSAVPGQVKGVS